MMPNNNNDDDRSSTVPDARILLCQEEVAKAVWPGQYVHNIGTTSCGLVIALYQGHIAVSCYHWPFLNASDDYINTFLALGKGKKLRKVVIITNGIRGGDVERENRKAEFKIIRRRVGCPIEYYMLTSARDTDPCVRIQGNSEPIIQASNRLFVKKGISKKNK